MTAAYVNIASFNRFVGDSVGAYGKVTAPAANARIVETTALTGFYQFDVQVGVRYNNEVPAADFDNMAIRVGSSILHTILYHISCRDSKGVSSDIKSFYRRMNNEKLTVSAITAGTSNTTYVASIIANKIDD